MNQISEKRRHDGCYSALATLALSTMGYTRSTRNARAAAREARLAKRRQQFDDARANLRDLNAFLDASQRLAESELWFEARLADLHAQADQRRSACRQDAARSIQAMTARGMTAEEIAWMAGMTTGAIQEFITRTA